MPVPLEKIMVRIPSRGTVTDDAANMLFLLKGMHPKLDLRCHNQKLSVSLARHEIVKEFLESPKDYLIMVDSDIVAPPSLLNLPLWEVDIVGGICPGLKNEILPFPLLYEFRNEDGPRTECTLWNIDGFPWNTPQLVEVHGIGTGAICIHRRVFEHPDMALPFQPFRDSGGKNLIGTDLSFCIRARKAGFKVYVDASLLTDHVADHISLLRLSRLVAELVQKILTGEDVKVIRAKGADSPEIPMVGRGEVIQIK